MSSPTNGGSGGDRPTVALFVTCLVDLFRPNVGFAAVTLLERAGCDVAAPEAQTCCGQPAFNSGASADARAIARQVIETFEPYEFVVAPSGSCAGMIRAHYPEMFEGDPHWGPRSRAVADKTFELVSFLHDIRGVAKVSARYDGTVTYHDSCSGLREMGVKHQPRRLLDGVEGLTVREMASPEVCCGFGGLFCVKYPEISNRMVSDKAGEIVATGADTLLAGDLGCLLNMAGKLRRSGGGVRVRHVAEVLAGALDEPAIGEPEER